MDEEAAKPCIKDRLRAISKDIIEFFQIMCLTIVILMFIVIPEILPILYGREVIIPIFSEISLEGRFTIVFSLSVILFSSVQYRSERKRNTINDLRNELEKAYGPLYSLFNIFFLEQSGGINLEGELIPLINININKSEKEKLDFILSNYPFMFKPEIFNYWREYLQYYQGIKMDSDEQIFSIDYEFIQMIQGEYHLRIEEYHNLLGKKSARS